MKNAVKRGTLIVLCILLNAFLNNRMISFWGSVVLSVINLIFFVIGAVKNKKTIKCLIFGVSCILAFVLVYILKNIQIVKVIYFINIFIFVFELADFMRLKNPKNIELIVFVSLSIIAVCSITAMSILTENNCIKEEQQLLASIENMNNSNLHKKELMSELEKIIEKDIYNLEISYENVVELPKILDKNSELKFYENEKESIIDTTKYKLEILLMNLDRDTANLSDAKKEIESNINDLNISINTHESNRTNILVFSLFECLEIIVLFLKSDELKISSNVII